METNIHPDYKETARGQLAESILRTCVHCGFCTATCPTYQELGDELDGPRGRIYQIKNMLEGETPGRETQQHLDRCLTCLNCMTTCPSGVQYDKLIDIGREITEEQVPRPLGEKFLRWGLRQVLPYSQRFDSLLSLARVARPLMPAVLKSKITPAQKCIKATGLKQHERKIILHKGCVQPTLTPATDAAAARVLDSLGIELISPQDSGCCGAVSQHLSASDEAKAFVRRNIDAWWPAIEAGAEAILVTASGCGVMVKDYGHLLADDSQYAEKAARVSSLTRDLSEILTADDIKGLGSKAPKKIAFHAPCTLQHGQKLPGKVESLLTAAGFELTPIRDAHSCCGSAGTYSVLQPELSQKLLRKKLNALQESSPTLIATANVGCQTHLDTKADVRVIHWIELFDPEAHWI